MPLRSSLPARRGILAGLLALPWMAAGASAQESWARYRNARFGTAIDYMEFFEPAEAPANGDGQVFNSPEATFRVFGRHNTGGETPQGLLASLSADPAYRGISYKTIQGRRLTVSGRRGVSIFYEVYLFGPSGVVHTFMIEYPAAHKAAYDAMVARMARSFTGP